MLDNTTYQELVHTVRDLPLRPIDGHLVASLLGTGEDNLAVVLGLQLVNLAETGKQLPVVEPVDVDDL